MLEAEGIVSDIEVSLLFVDEPTIAELHERFLGKEGPTDVLAFPIDEEPDRERPVARRGGHRARLDRGRERRACSCSATW